MSRFKTLFSVFFLVVFTFNVIIYYSLFEFSEIQAKAEMSETISSLPSLSKTDKFILPLSRLNEVRHQEIWLEGSLYDIVKTEVKGDSVVVYVLNDKKEQTLVERMKDHEEQCSCKANLDRRCHPGTKHASKPAPHKYIPGVAIISFHYNLNDTLVSCEINCFYTTTAPAIVAPPPEHIVS
jgi:mRNA-degrading endonuclease YafQ of YafQ-DinJ toxin-antitoxin module